MLPFATTPPPQKPKKKKFKEPTLDIVNPYELAGGKKHQPPTINPYKKLHNISVSFRGLLIGSSGAGKTATLYNIIKIMPKTFNHLYVYCQAPEPIYDHLQEVLGPDVCTVKYGIKALIDFPVKNYYGQSLVVCDDMVNESVQNHKVIQELFIRGRKMGSGGISTLYLTQSYFDVPKIIRSQCTYIWIIKVQSLNDLGLIMRQYALSATKEQMIAMYEYATQQFGDFFLIDKVVPQNSGKTFRKRFDEYLNPDAF